MTIKAANLAEAKKLLRRRGIRAEELGAGNILWKRKTTP